VAGERPARARAEAEAWHGCALRIRDVLRARYPANGRALGWGEAWAPPQTATVEELPGGSDLVPDAAAGPDAAAVAEPEPEPEAQRQSLGPQVEAQQEAEQAQQEVEQVPQLVESPANTAGGEPAADGAAAEVAATEGAAVDGWAAVERGTLPTNPEAAAGGSAAASVPAPGPAVRRRRDWRGAIARAGLVVALSFVACAARRRR
jgi:hypothetical protein